MLKIPLLILTIGYLVPLNSLYNNRTDYSFPCFRKQNDGYCVPKRECCSSKQWYYNKNDHGNCSYNQFCCTDFVFCQKCPNGTTEVNDSCVDINECKETYGLCSGQPCNNTNGGYLCDCDEGYEELEAELKTCEALNRSKSVELLFSASLTINLMTFEPIIANIYENPINERKIRMIYSGTASPHSIDYSLEGNYMAWTDITLNQINLAPINSEEPSLVMDRVLLRFPIKPNCLSIDWIHNLLFWTDLKTRTINVVNIMKPFDFYVVINNTNQEPNELVVNMLNNTLVWTLIGDKTRIMQSLEDGSKQELFYSKSSPVFCLTIDIFIKRYYFIDLSFNLYSISFEGKDERRIFSSENLLNGINSMSIHFNDIYMSTNNLIYKINKFGHFNKYKGQRVEALVASLDVNPNNRSFILENLTQSRRHHLFNIKIIDSILQPKLENKCQFAKCSHLCLPSDSTKVFQCVCPPNTILVENSVCSEKHFETLVIESMFWEKDLQKLIEHSVTKSMSLRKLLNQSLERQTDLKQLFEDDMNASKKMREIFNLTTKHNYEIKKTLIQTINETLFWKRILNSTFDKKNKFEKLLNHSYYTKNFTELLQLLKSLTEDDLTVTSYSDTGLRIGEIVILGFILLAIITLIILLSYTGYKLIVLNRYSTQTTQKYATHSYRQPIYERTHEIRATNDLESIT